MNESYYSTKSVRFRVSRQTAQQVFFIGVCLSGRLRLTYSLSAPPQALILRWNDPRLHARETGPALAGRRLRGRLAGCDLSGRRGVDRCPEPADRVDAATGPPSRLALLISSAERMDARREPRCGFAAGLVRLGGRFRSGKQRSALPVGHRFPDVGLQSAGAVCGDDDPEIRGGRASNAAGSRGAVDGCRTARAHDRVVAFGAARLELRHRRGGGTAERSHAGRPAQRTRHARSYGVQPGAMHWKPRGFTSSAFPTRTRPRSCACR